MNPFEFYNPVRVLFGPGVIDTSGQEASQLGNKALLVTYREHDFFQELITNLIALLAKHGVTTIPFFEIEANPSIESCEQGTVLAKSEKVDLVIGLGGGSAMDAAKVIAAGVKYSAPLWNMVASRHDIFQAQFPQEALPTLMIPTLPATGSEMNCCAVITNQATTEKSYVWDPCLFPRVSIVDPKLCCSLPPFQSACGAADTISHVMEFYLNGQEDSPLNNRIQEGIMLTVMEKILRVLDNPHDLSARGQLQWASILAQNGISQPGDAWTPMHQLGHVLSARYNIPHGASLSIIMPAWMKTLYPRRPDQYLQFARRVCHIISENKTSTAIILEGIDYFSSFLKIIGVPTSLSEVGIPQNEIEAIVDDVTRISFNANHMLTCTPPVNRDDITAVFTAAMSMTEPEFKFRHENCR